MRTFPILVSFDGKPPLVTGGGELAAVKARLLLKRAPCVDIAADMVGNSICEVAAEHLSCATDREPYADPEGLFISSIPLRCEYYPSGDDCSLCSTEKEAASQE